ncbi:MAG: OmpA family protein [Bacteroidaceae bacterium]|nr:OmpA family protein [Bacteroidaceae bacterium]
MRKYSHIIQALLVLLLMTGCGAEKNVKKGDAFFAIGEYFNAAAEYKKAYARTAVKDKDKRGERAWKMAECYRKVNYTAKAAGAYQNAIRYKYPDSLAILYLAQAQHKQGDYKNAIKNYDAFLELVPNHTLARNGRQGCLLAPEWKQKPTLYTIRKEPILNSRRADFSPVLYGDEWDQLYVSSSRSQAVGDEISGITGTKSTDIFVSKKDDKGKWGQPETIESELNTFYEEGACCFSPDGKTMYFTRCTFDAEYPRYAEIFTSSRTDASWGNPQRLEISKDTLSSYAHPAITPDGLWLYFVSDMPGGLGGLDIWRIAITDQGLGGVENVGAPINTEGDEMFPTFRPNGDLYFSSDGHPGMGGLDIFCAQTDSTGNWHVENMRVPMNSSGDDFGMTFEGPYNRGFFATSRGDGRGWDHIMSFECPEVVLTVKGWVYEKDGYELPEGLVYMVGNDGTYLKLNVKSDGSFTQEIKPHVDYVFLGTCTGYLNHKEELQVDTSSVSREYVLQFPLASINNPVLIRNVFYEFDSAALTESSTQALDSLVDLLNENPNVTIELSSHCDFRGKDEYNMRLSQRRAESVVSYLIEHGIAEDRLTAMGYGESRPKVVTRKIAEQNDFLHEGDTLTEAFILALEDEEHQEVCHALNRRTEFKVLRTTYGLFELKTPEKAKIDVDATKAAEEQSESKPAEGQPQTKPAEDQTQAKTAEEQTKGDASANTPERKQPQPQAKAEAPQPKTEKND